MAAADGLSNDVSVVRRRIPLVVLQVKRLVDARRGGPRAALLLQELLDGYACLLEDGSEGAFRHIAGMVWDGGVAVACRVEPDLVRPGSLAVELKPKRLSLLTIWRYLNPARRPISGRR